MRSLRDYEVLSFDCYGTLIDWESGIWTALQPMLLANDAQVSRPEVLAEFGRIEAAQEAGQPFPPCTPICLPSCTGISPRVSISRATTTWTARLEHRCPIGPSLPIPRAPSTFLAERYRLVILSNVDRTSFAGSNERLEVEFDAIYTAEDIGSYKPDPANFDYLLGHLEDDFDVVADSVLHIAQSLYHDHAPAKAAGLGHGMDRPSAPLGRRRVGCDHPDRAPTRARPCVLLDGRHGPRSRKPDRGGLSDEGGRLTRMSHDVVIVGGGAMGSSTAYHLMKADPSLSVVVIERDSSYARASTILSDGNVRIQFNLEENIRMSQYALEVLRTFDEDMATANLPARRRGQAPGKPVPRRRGGQVRGPEGYRDAEKPGL